MYNLVYNVFCWIIVLIVCHNVQSITRNYSPCFECPNISNDPTGTPYRWEIGYNHTAAFVKDNYTDESFIPGNEYEIILKWYQYGVCGQVHGNCQANFIYPPADDPDFFCPEYDDDLDGKNRCVWVDWMIIDPNGKTIDNFEHNDLYFQGSYSSLKYRVNKLGVYTFLAKHSGWNDCQNDNSIEFDKIDPYTSNPVCTNLPNESELIHSFTLTLGYEPVFGVDAGASTGVDKTPSYLSRAKSNHFNVASYFAQEFDIQNNIKFLNEAKNQNMNVTMVFGIGREWSPGIPRPDLGVGITEIFQPQVLHPSIWLNSLLEGSYDDPINDPNFSSPSLSGENPEEYATWVFYRLNQLQTFIIDGTITSVRLGNEEDVKWWNNSPQDTNDPQYLQGSKKSHSFDSGGNHTPDPVLISGSDKFLEPGEYITEFGNQFYKGDYDDGRDYGDFFFVASKAVKDNFPGLIVIGGSFAGHDQLGYLPPAYAQNVNRGSTGEFVRGFYDRVIERSIAIQNKTGYLPDGLAIHTYTLERPPEWFNRSTDPLTNLHFPHTDFFKKIEQIYKLHEDIFNASYNQVDLQHIPNFYDTEYAFGTSFDAFSPLQVPTQNIPFGLDTNQLLNPSQYTQAVYFLRSSLIKGCSIFNGRKWKNSIYFHHSEPESVISFFDNDNASTPRLIHGVADILFNDSIYNLGLNNFYKNIWIPSNTNPPDPEVFNDEGTGWCGWQSGDTYWIAIWRYAEYQWFFHPSQSQSEQVALDDINYEVIDFYRISFGSNLDSYPTFQSLKGIVPDPVINIDSTITINGVTENPLFVKLKKIY